MLVAILFCSSMMVSKPMVKAASTGWLRADIGSVSIIKNSSKYNNSYLISLVKNDCFQAIFKYDNSTGKITSSKPTSVRLLYGSYTVSSSSIGSNGHSATVTYKYTMNTVSATAKVTATYYF